MTFGEALDAMAAGKRVRCVEWAETSPYSYVTWSPGKHPKNSSGLDWVITVSDFKDFPKWQLWEEPGNDFQWALAQMKAGKVVKRRDNTRYASRGGQSSQTASITKLDPNYVEFTLAEIEATDWVLAS